MRFDAVTTSVPVRPADLDSVGHVNNARVLEYLEHARWHWMRHHGLDRGERIIPVVARIEVDYRREVFWGELSIRTSLADENTVYKAVFDQVIYSGAVPAVTAKVHVAFIDGVDRSIRALAEFLDARPSAEAVAAPD